MEVSFELYNKYYVFIEIPFKAGVYKVTDPHNPVLIPIKKREKYVYKKVM